MRLVLASASPRRAELLRAAGFTFDVVPADVDERVRGGEAAGRLRPAAGGEKSARGAGTHASALSAPRAEVRLTTDDRRPRRRHGRGRRRRDPRQAARRRGRGRACSGGCRAGAHEVLTGVSLRSSAGGTGTDRDHRRLFGGRSREDEVAWYVPAGKGATRRGPTPSRGWRRASSRESTGRTRTSSGCRSPCRLFGSS